MASPLSNLVYNVSERIHGNQCKYEHDDKKCEICATKYKYYNCFLEYANFKDGLIEYKCFGCNKNCQKKFNEKLKEIIFNTNKFSNHDNSKLFLIIARCLALRIYEWLEKIQWNIITWKRRFL